MSKQEFTEFQTKKMYRAKELAEFLGCGISTIWRYNSQQKIKSYKLSGGITVFNIDEVMNDLGLKGGEE